MRLDEAARELGSQKFSYVAAGQWALDRTRPDAWSDLVDSWNRLETDHYMKHGDRYRQRRFCKFRVDPSTMSFQELDDYVFHQTTEINSYAGGMRREFSPVEPSIRQNTVLREIVESCLEAILLSADCPRATWKVFVHQFRIQCSHRVTGQPTPEGLHRDGHDYISMHLMNRVGVEGGVSSICDEQRRSLMSVTLENRMDSFLVNDRALLHGVSQITPSTAEPGYRDMLVIDYNRER
ncbi:MAG: hypothetical protein JWQ11_1826 [Rhizobacter sp.]|nr:hypothetical protein [Rhizobacter sp.]